jgi:hypothetical protein
MSNFGDLPVRSDVQDTDNFAGYRTAAAAGEGRWTWAVIKTALTTYFNSVYATVASVAAKADASATTAALATKAATSHTHAQSEVTGLVAALAAKHPLAVFSATAPSSPVAGQKWVETTTGIEWTWVVDVDSSQWVDFGAASLTKASQGQAEAGSDNAAYMTSLRTAQALTALLGTKSVDGTFAANSDAKLPTEKAVKTYVDTALAALFSAPTLISSSINSAGTSLTLGFSKPVSIGAGGNGGFLLNPTGADVTLTYASGAGTSTLVYTISRPILQTSEETAVVSYTQPGNGVEDLLGVDLVTISSPAAVTNGSTQTGASAPTLVAATVLTVSGAEYLDLEFSEAVTIGAGGHGLTLDASGGALTPTYSSGDGTDTLRFSLSRRVLDTETVDVDHTQAGNGIEADVGGLDVATFTGEAATNDSTHTAPAGTTDNFNAYSNGSLLSDAANWELVSALDHPKVQSGKVVPSNGVDTCVRHTGTLAANQYAEVDIDITSHAGLSAGVTARCASGANSYYGVTMYNNVLYLFKLVAGTKTDLANTVLGLGTGTLRLRLEVTGTGSATRLTVKYQLNSDAEQTPWSAYDPASTYLDGGFGGIHSWGADGDTQYAINEFRAGDL